MKPPRQALMQQYVQQIHAAAVTVVAGDPTAGSRPHAVTLQERTYEHQLQPSVGSKPVTLGQGYSTLSQTLKVASQSSPLGSPSSLSRSGATP